MEKLTLEKRQLCDIQGRLFELALTTGLDCPSFIKSFMDSKTADAETMSECWLGFHTFDVEMAIDDLKEIYELKSHERNAL